MKKTTDTVYDLAVVGAGPAGLMAAIAVGENGARVIVLDRMPKPGAKLLATGGGRCNLTNTLPTEQFMASFGRQGRFMQPAMEAMDSEALREFFDTLDVPTCCEDGFHVFPTSQSAIVVQKALVQRCEKLGVRIRLKHKVQGIWTDQDKLRGLHAVSADEPAKTLAIEARSVLIAAGGKSWPQLGSDGSGFSLAASVGHTIVPPKPGLAPLMTTETWPAQCAGVTLSPVRIWIDLKGQSKAGVTDDLLFTHTGISGPAALNVSLDVAALLKKNTVVPVRLELCPAVASQPGGWSSQIDRWGHEEGAKTIRVLIGQHIPAAIADIVCKQAAVMPMARCAQLSRPQRDALAKSLSGLPLTIRATEGFEHSMVTCGGVDLRQVNPHTLESRLLPGLYFAGEVLDLAGLCGGYNLQWAFSSGFLAGRSASPMPQNDATERRDEPPQH